MTTRAQEIEALSALLPELVRAGIDAELVALRRGEFVGSSIATAFRAKPELTRLVFAVAAEAAEWNLGGSVAIKAKDRSSFVVTVFPEQASAGVAVSWVVAKRGPAWRVYWVPAAGAESDDLEPALQVFAAMLSVYSGVPATVERA